MQETKKFYAQPTTPPQQRGQQALSTSSLTKLLSASATTIQAIRKRLLRTPSSAASSPEKSHIIDLREALKACASTPITWAALFDQCGVTPHKNTFIQIDDTTICEVRRKPLPASSGAKEIVWVRGVDGVTALNSKNPNHAPEHSNKKLVGFYCRTSQTAFSTMIEPRSSTQSPTWSIDNRVALSTAVHELAHGKGRREYMARVEQNAYLQKAGLPPLHATVFDTLEAVLKDYSPHAYFDAVHEATKEHNGAPLVVPVKSSLTKSDKVYLQAGIAVQTPSEKEASQSAIISYGLHSKGNAVLNSDYQIYRLHQNTGFEFERSAARSSSVGMPLGDVLCSLRGDVRFDKLVAFAGNALSWHIAHETMKTTQGAVSTEAQIKEIGDEIAKSFSTGDIHKLLITKIQKYCPDGNIKEYGVDGTVESISQVIDNHLLVLTRDRTIVLIAEGTLAGCAIELCGPQGTEKEGILAIKKLLKDDAAVATIAKKQRHHQRWEEQEIGEFAPHAKILFTATFDWRERVCKE